MKSSMKILPLAILAIAACQQKIDNEKSIHNFQVQMEASDTQIVLDESRADQTALTITWTAAKDYGDDYITSYEYTVEHTTSTAEGIHEYEDDGVFVREYTHRELQEMLINRFGQKTSSRSSLRFNVSATFSGPSLIIPDMASVVVSVKTYGPKQFAADEVFMAGTAVGDQPVKLSAGSNPDVYRYQGSLKAGSLNFPVKYDDENNLVVPEDPSAPLTTEPMAAKMVDQAEGGAWTIAAPDSYRVTLNFSTKTVTIIPVSQIFEVDKIFLAGSAVAGTEDVEVEKCIERNGLYAFKGELQAGTLYMPIEYDEARSLAIVSTTSGDIKDGQSASFGQAPVGAAASKAWNIPAAGVYRIVVDTDAKTVAIYSEATDMKNISVSYNNTVAGINPYTQDVTELWMYGGGIGWDKDPDEAKTGFQKKYRLMQSLADPTVFVYYGEAIPRKSIKDDNNKTGDYVGVTVTGWIKFLVSNIENNVWAYGSTLPAVRNSYSSYQTCDLGKTYDSVGNQGNARYAYFLVPEGANCVIVKINPADNTKATVKFEKR